MNQYQHSKFTKEMQSMLPQWMKMAKDEDSVGAQFLNVFGLEFEDVEKYLEATVRNMFISSADLGQIDIIYRIATQSPVLLEEGQNTSISIVYEDIPYVTHVASTVQEFYTSTLAEATSIIDKERGYIYFRIKREWMIQNIEKPVQSILVGGAHLFDYELQHVWNPFDEFGLLLGLYRLRGELNADFKERILDVFRNPANATRDGIRNGLARELGIRKEEVIVNELADYAFRKTLIQEDGTPSQRLLNIAKKTNEVLGSSWGSMTWDEAYWHSVEDGGRGLEYLPHIWDASMDAWKDEEFQSGIGDGDDLKVRAPEALEDRRDFKYFVGLRGKARGTELVKPEISFKYKILAKGRVTNSAYKPENFKYTIITSEIVKLHFIVRAHKTYYYDVAFDFKDSSMFTFDSQSDPQCEIVTGQTIMGNDKHPYLRIEAKLSTPLKTATPKLHAFRVLWEDTLGGKHTTEFTSRADFDRNDSMVVTDKLDILTTEAGDVELGYGDFYYLMETKEDFSKGKRFDNISIGQGGGIQLTPFKD